MSRTFMPFRHADNRSTDHTGASRASKSSKADGSAKVRWNAEERASRGRPPRRSAGRDAAGREERNGQWTPRGERPARFEGDRPRYDSDRPRYDSDRPRYDSDRPRYDSDRPRYDSDRPRYDSDRPRFGERGDGGRRESSAAPRGDRYDAPRRDSGWAPRSDASRGDRSDRPRGDRFDNQRGYDNQRPVRTDDNRFERRSEDNRFERRSDRFGSDRGQRFGSDRSDRYGSDRSDRYGSDRAQRYGSDRADRYGSDRADRYGSDRPVRRQEQAEYLADEPVTAVTEADGTDSRLDEQGTAAATPVVSFAELGLQPFIVEGLQAQGITSPFPIQAATIPDALSGKDVLGRGQTGSGKTLAFGLPLISRLTDGQHGAPRAMILVPTRELAMQVADSLSPLARAGGLSVTLIAGGMSYTPQIRAFERGVDIVVATPGRLIDLMEQSVVDLSRIEVAVLDEADHMADLGFMPAVTTLMDAVPDGGQRLLFSATLDGAVDRLVRTYLKDPVTHQVDSGRATVTTMEHKVVHVLPHHKLQITAEIAGREGRTVVFARTQLGVERVADQLRTSGVMAGALHGGLNQGARNRVLAAFKDGQLPVLVATDVAARGIHVDDVSLVLQIDPPAGPKEYLHRAGRTARAGGRGVVVTLALPHQRREVSRLAGQAGVTSQPVNAQPGDAELAEATGAKVPSGESYTTADYERLIAPKPAARGGGKGRRGPRPGNRNDRPRRGGFEGRPERGRSSVV